MRNVLRETKWRVQLTTPQGPIEKVIDAPSQDVAISRAMRAFPGQQFTQVTASQIDPQSNVPTAQASQQNELPQQIQPLQPIKQLATPAQILAAKQQQFAQQQVARESIDLTAIKYPYSITLPAQFRSILIQTSPVQVNESSGQYRIIIETQHAMATFFSNLKTHLDRASVRAIVSGIRSSIA